MSDRAARILSLLPFARYIASTYPPPFADRVQDGMVGACQAVDAFDPGRGASLATFARRRIHGAIADGYRRDDHLSRCQRASGVDPGAPLPLLDSDPAQVDAGFARVDDRLTVARLLDRLPARERYVVHAYYWQRRTLAHIGAELDLSAVAVSLIRRGAEARLREEGTP